MATTTRSSFPCPHQTQFPQLRTEAEIEPTLRVFHGKRALDLVFLLGTEEHRDRLSGVRSAFGARHGSDLYHEDSKNTLSCQRQVKSCPAAVRSLTCP